MIKPTLTLAATLALASLSSGVFAQDKTDPPKTDPQQTAPTAPPPATQPPTAPEKPIEKKIDPAAKKTIDDMIKTYQSLQALSGKMTFTAERGTEKKSLTTTFTLARPNKVNVLATVPGAAGTPVTRTIVSDGKKLFALASENTKTYLDAPAVPEPVNIARALGLSGGGGTGLFGILIADPDAGDKVLGEGVTVVEYGPDEKVDGIDSKLVKATLHVPAPTPAATQPDISLTFAVGKADSLLRRVVVSSMSPQGKYVLTELYSGLKLNPPLTDKTFTFTPPPGAKPQEPTAPPAPGAPAPAGPPAPNAPPPGTPPQPGTAPAP